MKTFLSIALLAATMATGAIAKEDTPPVEVLLSSTETSIGQLLIYPEGQAKMTASIVTMLPGQSTGAHIHNVPLFGYILEGELTVDYGPDGIKIFQAGDSLLEALKTPHTGTNTGSGIMRALVVFAGAEGVENSVVSE
jgi:quercetin dioxygenase-like cupin family protein